MKRTLILLLLCLSVQVSGQDATDIFKQYLSAKKVEKEYQVNINYAIYKGLNGTKAYEDYSGVQAKFNNVFYQKLHKTELVLGEYFMVKLNPEEKAMLVGYASKPVFSPLDQLDSTKILELFKAYTTTDQGKYWRITLTDPDHTLLTHFNKIELYINKENLRLEKQVIYYASIADFAAYDKTSTAQDFDTPRLEILFKNYQQKISIASESFEASSYFSYDNSEIKAASKYKGYEIIYAN